MSKLIWVFSIQLSFRYVKSVSSLELIGNGTPLIQIPGQVVACVAHAEAKSEKLQYIRKRMHATRLMSMTATIPDEKKKNVNCPVFPGRESREG